MSWKCWSNRHIFTTLNVGPMKAKTFFWDTLAIKQMHVSATEGWLNEYIWGPLWPVRVLSQGWTNFPPWPLTPMRPLGAMHCQSIRLDNLSPKVQTDTDSETHTEDKIGSDLNEQKGTVGQSLVSENTPDSTVHKYWLFTRWVLVWLNEH